MNRTIVFEQVLVLFIIMLIGVYVKKRGMINRQTNRKLSELLLNVTLPAMIIISFQLDFSPDMLYNAAILFVIAIGVHTLSALLGWVLYIRYPSNVKKVLRFVTVFSNCGFMGFPVLESLYGRIGVFYGSIYVIVFNIFIWTYGVMLLQGKKDLSTMKKALVNPGIIAVGIGMFFFLFSIELPYPIFQSLDMVGAMTTPIAMLIVGAILAEAEVSELFTGYPLYYGTIVRLIVLPLVTLGILSLWSLPELLLSISVILVAMPAAANTAIFAETYDADTVLASRLIAVSTMLSMVTIPVVILFT